MEKTFYIYNPKKELMFVTPVWRNAIFFVQENFGIVLDYEEFRECLNSFDMYRNQFYITDLHIFKSERIRRVA